MKADKINYWAYNGKLQPYANKLRKEMTKAEACLWKYVLRAGKMEGLPVSPTKAYFKFYCRFYVQRAETNY